MTTHIDGRGRGVSGGSSAEAARHWLEYWRGMTLCDIDISLSADGTPRFRKDGHTQRAGYVPPVELVRATSAVTCPTCLRKLLEKEAASLESLTDDLNDRRARYMVETRRLTKLIGAAE